MVAAWIVWLAGPNTVLWDGIMFLVALALTGMVIILKIAAGSAKQSSTERKQPRLKHTQAIDNLNLTTTMNIQTMNKLNKILDKIDRKLSQRTLNDKIY